jgi:hypothetical protein
MSHFPKKTKKIKKNDIFPPPHARSLRSTTKDPHTDLGQEVDHPQKDPHTDLGQQVDHPQNPHTDLDIKLAYSPQVKIANPLHRILDKKWADPPSAKSFTHNFWTARG